MLSEIKMLSIDGISLKQLFINGTLVWEIPISLSVDVEEETTEE